MRRAAFIFLISILTIELSAQVIPAPTSGSQDPGDFIQNIYGRKNVFLNGRWNYIVDPYETGFYNYRRQPFDQTESGTGGYFDDRKLTDKTELMEYDFDLSPTLTVPGDWNSQVPNLELYEGTIWYRKRIDIQPKAGNRYLLYFGAANYETHVYLNGKKLGVHNGGFTPFQFEVTGKLVSGSNSIVVKVDNTRKPDEIPTVNTDWWNYGGITRDVMLTELPANYITDYKVQLAKNKPGIIEGFVRMSGPAADGQGSISIPELGLKTPATSFTNSMFTVELPVKKIIYWSPENPKLYDVIITAGSDTVRDRIGFRTIETRGQDILLNGKSVFLRGISIHEENPLIPGRLRGQGDMRMMLQWAKDMNCNYVRLAHYPHSEEMIRLADEMGLLVWGEVPVYWTISWLNPATYANAEKQLTDLINRDKNRASVIVWSVGNETPLSEPRHQFMGKLVDRARSLDNTRLVAAALEVHRVNKTVIVDDPLGEKIDLVSFNEYAGWYWGKLDEILENDFSIKYNKPVVITEFGGDALGGFHAGVGTRFSEEYQEELYRIQLQWLPKMPGLRGMTPWILTDFRSPRRPHPVYQNFWNRKGLISETGKKKKAFWVLKGYYDTMQKKYQ
ncbi:MAG: glycoside hydrolase family 2 TIM barrel-domain containing protein [Chitinophagaceae bacterium]